MVVGCRNCSVESMFLSLFVLQETDVQSGDFHQKLVDSALSSMDAYMTQFPEIKVDYGTNYWNVIALQNISMR